MEIYNMDAITKTHPNFEQERDTVEQLYAYFLKLENCNYEKYLNPGYRIVHSKKYFLSSQIKEVYYRDSDRTIGMDLAIDYNKDGSIFIVSIESTGILSACCPDARFNGVSITHFGEKQRTVNFKVDSLPVAQISCIFTDNVFKLTDYKIKK